MKYFKMEHKEEPIQIDDLFTTSVESLASVEDFGEFCKKMIYRIGAFFGHHASMASYIKTNMKLFDDLNPNALVRTVTIKDLASVSHAINTINEGLEKLRLGDKIDLKEFCAEALELVGIEYERGRISMAKFKSGNWGEGKDKDGLDHPMTYKKTIEEFGWKDGAKHYAEKFVVMAGNTTAKSKLIAASNRHYADVKNAMARGLSRNRAVFDKEVAVDQINQLNICRDVLIRFYFKQLLAIMKGAFVQPIGKPPPGEIQLPNNFLAP